MPDLEELQKKLYTPLRPILPPAEIGSVPAQSLPETPVLPSEEFSKRSWRKFIFGLAIFVLLALSVAVFIFYRGFYAFRKDRVVITLIGPEEIVAGQEAQWHLTIDNKNETALKEGELNFRFPDYSKPIVSQEELNQFENNLLKQIISIPELAAGGKFEKEFSAILMGGENTERKAQAVFNFKPSSGSIIFESIATQTVKISNLPLEMQIDFKPEIISGKVASLELNLINRGQVPFNDLRLRWEYPSGFKFLTSSQKLNDFNNTWLISEILPSEAKNFNLKGEVSGLEGEVKVFRVFIESREGENWKVYKEAKAELNLIAEPLVLYLSTVPDGQRFVTAGNIVTYKLNWKNNLNIPLEDLVLKVKLTGEAFDFNTLISDGNFNSNNQTITWSQSSQPFMANIQPLEQQEVNFQIKLKNVSLAGATQNITIASTLSSPTQPEGLATDQIISEKSLTLEVLP